MENRIPKPISFKGWLLGLLTVPEEDGLGTIDLFAEEYFLQLLGFAAADGVVAHFPHFQYFLTDCVLLGLGEGDPPYFGQLYAEGRGMRGVLSEGAAVVGRGQRPRNGKRQSPRLFRRLSFAAMH